VYVIRLFGLLEQKKCGEKELSPPYRLNLSRLEVPLHFSQENDRIRVHSRGPFAINQFPVDGKLEDSASGGNEFKGFDLVLVLAQ